MKTSIINNITTSSTVIFTVSEDHDYGHFGQDGFSKYHERIKMKTEGTLPEGEQVYGYDQAIEHIAELKKSVYQGKKHHEDKPFEIRMQTVSSVIVKLPPQ